MGREIFYFCFLGTWSRSHWKKGLREDQGQDAFLLGVKPNEGLAEVLSDNKAIKQVLLQARENLFGYDMLPEKRSI